MSDKARELARSLGKNAAEWISKDLPQPLSEAMKIHYAEIMAGVIYPALAAAEKMAAAISATTPRDIPTRDPSPLRTALDEWRAATGK